MARKAIVVYVNSQLPAAVWPSPNDTPLFELLWVRVRADSRDVVIG